MNRLFFFALTAVLETGAVVETVRLSGASMERLGWVVGLHVLACLMLTPAAAGVLGASFRNKRWITWPFAFGLSVTLPVLGPLLVLALVYLRRWVPPKPRDQNLLITEEMIREGEEAVTKGASRTERSILDVLKRSDVDARRNAILSLRDLHDPASVSVLLYAVRDSDEHVRSYAQSRLRKLNEKLEQELHDLQDICRKNPGNVKAWVKQGEQYSEMIHLGIVDHESVPVFYKRAVQAAEKALEIDPDNHSAHVLAVRCHLAQNHSHEAMRHLVALRSMGVNNARMALWGLEVLYQQREWETFVKMLGELAIQFPSPEVRRVINFWFREERT